MIFPFINQVMYMFSIVGFVAVIGGVIVGYIPNTGLLKKILTGLFVVTLILATLSTIINNNFAIIFWLLNFISLHLIIMSFIENRNIFLRILISVSVIIFFTSSLSSGIIYFIGKIFI